MRKDEIDRHLWCNGRTGSFSNPKIKPAMVDCYWNVAIKLVITNLEGLICSRYRWDAFTNDSCPVRFEQEAWTSSRDRYACKEDWKKFAKLNKLKHYGFMPLFGTYIDEFLNSQPYEIGGDLESEIRDKLGAMNNEYASLGSYLYFEHGRFGGDTISANERTIRRKEMRSDGRMKRMKELEKIMKTRNADALLDYNNQSYLHDYNPEKYGKKAAK